MTRKVAERLFERSKIQRDPSTLWLARCGCFPVGTSRGRRVRDDRHRPAPRPDAHGLVLNYRDITERALYQEQLTQQAFHDPLTGLPNRARFQERLEFALQALRWMSVQIAMDDFGTATRH